MKWLDAAEIAAMLAEKHPGMDPLKARFTDLHRWVLELEGFADEPARSNEKLLEAIQLAWLDEVSP